MGQMSLSELLKLPVPERIRLVEAIWDSIAAAPDALELSDAEREELDRRWEAFERDPSVGSPWSDVRARILRNG
ncbi:MAG TPA: addiction module protein [Gemmatimonadales bacterium]|nr:addiction module protein [Gemmatimonadales bacterium]